MVVMIWLFGYLAIWLGRLLNSSMMAKRLINRRQYVCAAPSYIAKYGTPYALSELIQHNCLIGILLKKANLRR
jgi:hypothetical protein